LVAHRIVFHKKVGDRVERGERVGLIKFGSRVDLFLPLDLAPQVGVGDRVKGGSSWIARPASVRSQQARSEAGPTAVRIAEVHNR